MNTNPEACTFICAPSESFQSGLEALRDQVLSLDYAERHRWRVTVTKALAHSNRGCTYWLNAYRQEPLNATPTAPVKVTIHATEGADFPM